MEFPERLKEFCDRLKALRSKIRTEEATETPPIMPFFGLLGYDVFNPLKFVPECTADVGITLELKIYRRTYFICNVSKMMCIFMKNLYIKPCKR